MHHADELRATAHAMLDEADRLQEQHDKTSQDELFEYMDGLTFEALEMAYRDEVRVAWSKYTDTKDSDHSAIKTFRDRIASLKAKHMAACAVADVGPVKPEKHLVDFFMELVGANKVS